MDKEKIQTEIANKLNEMTPEEQLKFLSGIRDLLKETNAISLEYLEDLKKVSKKSS